MSGAPFLGEPTPADSSGAVATGIRVPAVLAGGRWHTAGDMERMVRRWRAAALEAVETGSEYLATPPPATAEGVALLVALTALPVPGILLDPDPQAWSRLSPLPPRTRLLLPPSLRHLAAAADVLGCATTVLSDHDTRRDDSPLELRSPGVVIFTSGSTGAPKPVFRSMPALIGAAGARLTALGVAPGGGIVAGTSLAHGRGMTCLASALLLGGPVGLLGPVNHRAALAALAMPEFTCWWASSHLLDVLGRCELRGPAVAPQHCLISSPLSSRVFDRFAERFGVPIRQTYSSSETGCITVDAAPAAAVRPETVGRVVAGVDLRIGEHPAAPVPAGETGRIWVRSPWAMSGYGFPPVVERTGEVDGWWPTRDLGWLDADGCLALAGRLDDCIRTREGQLVNLAAVARQLEDLSGVTAAVVVPLEGSAGWSFGAVVECASSLSPHAFRGRVTDVLPAWGRPRRLVLVRALPRLATGKPDRLACQAVLATDAGA